MQTSALREALRLHRLQHKWSHRELLEDMRAVLGDRAPSMRTVYYFLRDGRNPYETTEHVIGEYLKAQGVEVAA